MDTLIVTQAMVNGWRIPSFQRPIRINSKVEAVAEQIRRTESIEGVLTLGAIRSEAGTLYIVDGQHRVEAFKLSGLEEAIADVRVCIFDALGDMAQEFVQLNSSLVKMRPDDILRGLENSTASLKAIRKACSFVGYDYIRRGTTSPIVGMSAVLRCWNAATSETPSPNGGITTTALAANLDPTGTQNLIAFLSTAHSAWGRDPEYYRLWGNLNLSLCMWLWNRLVIDRDRYGNKRYAILDIPTFKKCLMSLSADGDYVAWLQGRILRDRDRSPAYTRIKNVFSRRIVDETGKKQSLPSPAWASS